MSALVLAEDGENEEAQEVAVCHHSSTLRLCEMGLLLKDVEGQFVATHLGELILRKETLTRDLKRTQSEIEEEYKNQKPAMRALLRFGGIAKK